MSDGTRLTRAAYETLIDGDLSWLRVQEPTLERDHIIRIVERSAAHEYAKPETVGLRELREARKAVIEAATALANEPPAPDYTCSERSKIAEWERERDWRVDMTRRAVERFQAAEKALREAEL